MLVLCFVLFPFRMLALLTKLLPSLCPLEKEMCSLSSRGCSDPCIGPTLIPGLLCTVWRQKDSNYTKLLIEKATL